MGYDLQATETTVVPNLWKLQRAGEDPKPVLAKTGIKTHMPDSEHLGLVSRSSNPLKRSLPPTSGVGVISSGYYNSEDNGGHITLQFLNSEYEDVVIEKGERVGQGTFKPFLLANDG